MEVDMVEITIDDDINQFLLRKARVVGESASEILRRELGLERKTPKSPLKTEEQSFRNLGAVNESFSPLQMFLQSRQFLVHGDAVSKFLAILSWLYGQHTGSFEALLGIEGRQRKYFGKSEKELEESGRSVMPKKIPMSPYWVVTNNDTGRKRKMLADAMRVLGYSMMEISLATSHIT
jgi:negative modulator of initiation of replication